MSESSTDSVSTYQQDLRHLLQGIAVTLALVGAIATIGATLYLLLMLIIANKRAFFEKLKVPGLTSWLFFVAMIEVPLWIGLTRIRFVSKFFGRSMMILMGAIAVFTLVGGLLLPD